MYTGMRDKNYTAVLRRAYWRQPIMLQDFLIIGSTFASEVLATSEVPPPYLVLPSEFLSQVRPENLRLGRVASHSGEKY